MIQTRATQSLVDAHRRDLVASAGPRRGGAKGNPESADVPAGTRAAAVLPLPGPPAGRRAVAPRLGAWLIQFGTKLGGATIRTS